MMIGARMLLVQLKKVQTRMNKKLYEHAWKFQGVDCLLAMGRVDVQ
jgi:hypothetical protein